MTYRDPDADPRVVREVPVEPVRELIMRWPAAGKYWNGEPIDPFVALGGGRGKR